MSVLAHAGGTGWDEITMAVLPFVFSGGLFLLIRRRAERSDIDTAPSQ